MLRKFLFLDVDTVGDYLASLEGGVIEGDVEETSISKTEKDGGVDAKVVKGGIALEDSDEIKWKKTVTEASKFQRLYKLLDHSEEIDIKYLDAFDINYWNGLRRDDVLEIQASVELPDLFLKILSLSQLGDFIEGLSPYIRLADTLSDALGEDLSPDPKTKASFEAMETTGKAASSLKDGLQKRKVPIVFRAVSTPKFSFFAELPWRHIRCEKVTDLSGEATVFGKVLRVVSPGQKLDVFSISSEFSLLSEAFGSPNREARRAMKKKAASEGVQTIKGPAIVLDACRARVTSTPRIVQTIKGPAIVLDAIAVYK